MDLNDIHQLASLPGKEIYGVPVGNLVNAIEAGSEEIKRLKAAGLEQTDAIRIQMERAMKAEAEQSRNALKLVLLAKIEGERDELRGIRDRVCRERDAARAEAKAQFDNSLRLSAEIEQLKADLALAGTVMESDRLRNAAQAARIKELEAKKHEADGFLASLMDTVNQEIRENGPADVGKYYRRHDANNGVRYLADLLKRKAWDAEAKVAAQAVNISNLNAELNETFFDPAFGPDAWRRPTAEAYARVCVLYRKAKETIEEYETIFERAFHTLDNLALRSTNEDDRRNLCASLAEDFSHGREECVKRFAKKAFAEHDVVEAAVAHHEALKAIAISVRDERLHKAAEVRGNRLAEKIIALRKVREGTNG